MKVAFKRKICFLKLIEAACVCFCVISILLTLSLRCGSLIFDVVFKFSTVFAEDETFSIIQNAIVDGKLGELSMNVSYIIGIPRFPQTTITAPASITSKSYGLFQIFSDSGSINLSACYSLQLLF